MGNYGKMALEETWPTSNLHPVLTGSADPYKQCLKTAVVYETY